MPCKVDSSRLRSASGYKTQTTACFCPRPRGRGAWLGPTEPESFGPRLRSGHGDPLCSSRREQAAVEHGHLHDGVRVAVCCLLVCDALAGVGRIRLRTPPNLLHPGLQQRGQVRAGASSQGREGGGCHPPGWPRQHTKTHGYPPSLLLGQGRHGPRLPWLTRRHVGRAEVSFHCGRG